MNLVRLQDVFQQSTSFWNFMRKTKNKGYIASSAPLTHSIEFNELFQKALDRMENTSRHVFITGKAGTGKSTLLDYFRNHTSTKLIVLAPTGVSALKWSGKTIHS